MFTIWKHYSPSFLTQAFFLVLTLPACLSFRINFNIILVQLHKSKKKKLLIFFTGVGNVIGIYKFRVDICMMLSHPKIRNVLLVQCTFLSSQSVLKYSSCRLCQSHLLSSYITHYLTRFFFFFTVEIFLLLFLFVFLGSTTISSAHRGSFSSNSDASN